MQLPFNIITQDIIDEYKLTEISHNGKVYIEIRKGVYGLPRAGIIAHDVHHTRWWSPVSVFIVVE